MNFKPSTPNFDSSDLMKTVKSLHSSYFELVGTVEHVLRNLDEENVIRAKSVVADWVYAGNIDAKQIKTGKVTAEQIDATNLHVSSANIDGEIVADSVKSNWVYTGRILADQIDAGYIRGKIESNYILLKEGNGYTPSVALRPADGVEDGADDIIIWPYSPDTIEFSCNGLLSKANIRCGTINGYSLSDFATREWVLGLLG